MTEHPCVICTEPGTIYWTAFFIDLEDEVQPTNGGSFGQTVFCDEHYRDFLANIKRWFDEGRGRSAKCSDDVNKLRDALRARGLDTLAKLNDESLQAVIDGAKEWVGEFRWSWVHSAARYLTTGKYSAH